MRVEQMDATNPRRKKLSANRQFTIYKEAVAVGSLTVELVPRFGPPSTRGACTKA
jgi:hypothetical protein